jgi:hypothetical protein
MKLRYYLVLLLLCPVNAYAQHGHHKHLPAAQQKPADSRPVVPTPHEQKAPTPIKVATDTMAMDSMGSYTHFEGHKHMHGTKESSLQMMSSAFSLNLPMNRNGSGTGWNPDATPIFAYMLHKKEWMLMFHGDVFIRYNKQDMANNGTRGGEKWDAPSMLMAMAQRKVGKKGLFHANLMLSADAFIAGGSGYPLLFQTGETWEGKPLVDRQHPHDLFSELSVSYAYSFNKNSDVYAYIGYPAEPALGPVTFMHRPLGNFIPDAPLGHHWQDATHISFGVATLGYRYGKFKIEGSSFTGREPDENRYNFDKPLFDSWSGRLSFNPSANWALQLSQGYLKSPEALHPDDVERTTASVSYAYSCANNRQFAANGVIGRNNAHNIVSYAALAEGIYKLPKAVFYLRYEYTQKTGEDLVLDPMEYNADNKYPIQSMTFGGGYDFAQVAGITIAAGTQLAVYIPSNSLERLYGKTPLGGEIYLHLYPKRLQ